LGVALRARNLTKSIQNLTESVRTHSAYLVLGTLRVEIIEFHSTFSHHGNTQASLTLLIWLNEKVQKFSSKINRASR
jgi:hypothetical protein